MFSRLCLAMTIFTAAAGGADGADPAVPPVVLSIPGDAASYSFSPDGNFLAVGFFPSRDYPEGAAIYDLRSGKRLRRMNPKLITEVVAFSPDGKYLAMAITRKPQIIVIEANSGKELCRFETECSMRRMAFSPDGRRLAVTRGSPVWIYDVPEKKETGELRLKPFVDERHSIASLAFTPDGKELLGAVTSWQTNPDVTTILNLRTQKEVYPAVRYDREKEPGLVVFSPDYSYYVRTYRATKAEVRDSRTGKVKQTLVTKKHAFNPIAFDPRAKLLASGGDPGVILWNLENGKQVGAIDLTEGDVSWSASTMGLSPDGKYLAISTDRFLKVYDISKVREAIGDKLGKPPESPGTKP